MFTSHSSSVSHNPQQSSLPQWEVFIELLESLKGVITKFEFLVNGSLGLQNKSLNSQSPDFHVSAKLNLDKLSNVEEPQVFSKSADMHKVAPKEYKENFVDILETDNVVNEDVFDGVILSEKIDPGAPFSRFAVTEGNYKEGFAQVNSKSPILSDVNSVRDQAKTAVAVNDACSPAVSLGQNDFVLSDVDNQGGQATDGEDGRCREMVLVLL